MSKNWKLLISTAMLSMVAVGLAGCSDDKEPGGKLLPQGTEFNFGAVMDTDQTRTYYDPTDVNNPSATAWKIFWNYPDDLDRIYVYSPQGAGDRNQAAYIVNPESKGQTTAAKVTKVGAAGVQTSEAKSYDFYAMYPASAVKAGSAKDTQISATLPVNQVASTTEKMSTTAVDNLVTEADMKCNLMVATNEGFVPTDANKGTVNLQFKPFSTMLDITVNGIDGSNTQATKRITQVIVEADAPIAGDFTYDYKTGAFSFGDNASNSIAVETMFDDATVAGDKVGVMMGNNSTLKVRAFMIPNPNVKSLKVRIVTSDSRTLTKTLSMTGFHPSQIHFVSLPKIKVDELQFDYSIWLSQLDPNIYISEISLPGSALSFNYLMSDNYKKTQTLNLTDQFANGVRVFQCHVTLINQQSPIDQEDTSVGITDSDGNPVSKNDGSNTYWTLGDVMTALQSEMTGIHRDEFCVLAISDYIKSGSGVSLGDLYTRLNKVLKKAGADGYVATGVNANSTINDVKGKVIIKVQLNASNSSSWTNLSGANVWANIFATAATTGVYYSPMPFASLPGATSSGTSSSSLTGDMNLIYAEQANPVSYSFQVIGLRYRLDWASGVQNNATAVIDAYSSNYDPNKHDLFSMTYLGGVGAIGGSNTYMPSSVAQTLNTLWLNHTKPTNKPWGWIMFNSVGTAETTTQGIQAVLEHNAETGWKLGRRPATRTTPAGAKLTSGASLF